MTTINHLLAEVDHAWTSAVAIVWDSALDHQLKLTIVGALERGRIAQLDHLQRRPLTPTDICAAQGHQWKQWASHLNCERCNESIEIDCV